MKRKTQPPRWRKGMPTRCGIFVVLMSWGDLEIGRVYQESEPGTGRVLMLDLNDIHTYALDDPKGAAREVTHHYGPIRKPAKRKR